MQNSPLPRHHITIHRKESRSLYRAVISLNIRHTHANVQTQTVGCLSLQDNLVSVSVGVSDWLCNQIDCSASKTLQDNFKWTSTNPWNVFHLISKNWEHTLTQSATQTHWSPLKRCRNPQVTDWTLSYLFVMIKWCLKTERRERGDIKSTKLVVQRLLFGGHIYCKRWQPSLAIWWEGNNPPKRNYIGQVSEYRDTPHLQAHSLVSECAQKHKQTHTANGFYFTKTVLEEEKEKKLLSKHIKKRPWAERWVSWPLRPLIFHTIFHECAF